MGMRRYVMLRDEVYSAVKEYVQGRGDLLYAFVNVVDEEPRLQIAILEDIKGILSKMDVKVFNVSNLDEDEFNDNIMDIDDIIEDIKHDSRKES